jgi:heme/copper-type cytochrome/quinol oxidase subunit 2
MSRRRRNSMYAAIRDTTALLCLAVGCSSGGDDVAKDASESSPHMPSSGPVVVEARGRDFKWQFLTAGPDGKIASGDEEMLGNELVVPPAADVILVLTSEDYVYTLNVPDGRIEIAVPDMVHSVRFRSPAEGTHEFRTDPLCGLRYFHDEVLGTMRIASAGSTFESAPR